MAVLMGPPFVVYASSGLEKWPEILDLKEYQDVDYSIDARLPPVRFPAS